MYCGGTIIVRDAINAAAVASLPNLLKLARVALQSRNYREAYDYFTRVLEADSDNWEAWAGKGEASGSLSGPREFRLLEIVTCFGNALQSVPVTERLRIDERFASVVDKNAGQYYTEMRSALSPAFGQEFYWQSYLTETRRIIDALEDAHRLTPKNATILLAILHVCKNNLDTVSYLNQFNGRSSKRGIPDDMKTLMRKKIARYSKELENAGSPQ
jgi:tetratricopeptide (TPR) repeat protein